MNDLFLLGREEVMKETAPTNVERHYETPGVGER